MVASSLSTGRALEGRQRAIRIRQATETFQSGRAGGISGFSPEQQEVALGPHSQVFQAVHCEVLAPTQRLTKVLQLGGEASTCDALRAGHKRETGKCDLVTQGRGSRLYHPKLFKAFR